MPREESTIQLTSFAWRLRMLVDDTALNVDRARAAGWQALLLSDAAQLQRDLDNLLHYRNI